MNGSGYCIRCDPDMFLTSPNSQAGPSPLRPAWKFDDRRLEVLRGGSVSQSVRAYTLVDRLVSNDYDGKVPSSALP